MRTQTKSNPAATRRPGALPLAALACAAVLSLVAPPAAHAADVCKGRNVKHLGGSHAVDRKPIKDLADLQSRVPQLEQGMRDMLAEDPEIGPGVAEAIFEAIQSGSVVERKMAKKEPLQWMVYQPQRGKLARIEDPCVDLDREYGAFEILVEVPEPKPVAAQDARCELAVTRNCEHESPTITLDASGTSGTVTVSHGGQTMPAEGSSLEVADATPCSEDQTFVVHGTGTPPPPQTARVYRFLIPKVCSNLSYIGEEERKVIAAAGPPATCEKSVTAEMCQPWAAVSVDPSTVEVHNPVTVHASTGWPDCTGSASATCSGATEPVEIGAGGDASFTPGRSCCGGTGYELAVESRNAKGQTAQATTQLAVEPHAWTLRPTLTYFYPLDGDIDRDITRFWGQAAHEHYEISSGLGLGLALEKRIDDRWGIEGSAIFGRAETSYDLDSEGERGEVDHDANFYAFTVGPNIHLTQCKRADVYLGLFAGWGGLADPIYRVFDHKFEAQLDGKFVWGAQLGVDVPFDPTSDWGFHGGVRYMQLKQDTDAGSVDVNPLMVQVGLAYHF